MADVPTVTNVQVAQRLADDLDIEARDLDEKARIPQPPPVPGTVPQAWRGCGAIRRPRRGGVRTPPRRGARFHVTGDAGRYRSA